MIRVSIQDLKARLSSVIARAASGETIVVTRHNEAVAQLGPPSPHVTRGKRVGTSGLKPAVKIPRTGHYLDVLREDRGNR